jgi:hypothetical protein
MASPYPIRPVTEDDLLAVSAVHEHAFHTDIVIEVADEGCDWNQGRWRSRSGAGPAAAKPASASPMSSLRRPGRAALSTGWVWPNGRAHHKGPPR